MVEVNFGPVDPEEIMNSNDMSSDAFVGRDPQGDMNLQSFFDSRGSNGGLPAKMLDDRPSEPRDLESFFDEAASRPAQMVAGPHALDFFEESPSQSRPMEIMTDR